MTKKGELPRKKRKSQCQRRKMTPEDVFRRRKFWEKYRISDQKKKTKSGRGGRADRLFLSQQRERICQRYVRTGKKILFFLFFHLNRLCTVRGALDWKNGHKKCRKLFSFYFFIFPRGKSRRKSENYNHHSIPELAKQNKSRRQMKS